MTTHDAAGPTADLAQAALPADPFARESWLRGPAGSRLSHRLSGQAVFVLASLIVALLASSAAPTPLYAIYQAQWHFTPITTTVVFGVYAMAVLAALLTLGKLSDHVGRRPVLLTAIAVHAGSLVIFATATGVPALLSARVVQGLSTGAALGAIGAAMLDMDRELGTFANAVAPGMGSASGAIASALAVRFLPDPTHLIYLAVIGVLALQAVAIAAMRETVSRAPGALASLRPEITLPRALRAPVLTAVPVLFAVWALAGLYGALGPALVHALTGSGDVVLGSLSLFVLAASAVVAIIVLRRAAARTVMLFGILALITGVAVTVMAVSLGSVGGLLRGLGDRRRRVRQRLPGRHPAGGAAGRRARAGRPGLAALRGVLSRAGRARRAGRVRRGARRRADRHRPLLRRRGDRAGRAGPVRPAEDPARAAPRSLPPARPRAYDRQVCLGRWPSPWRSDKPPKARGGSGGRPPGASRARPSARERLLAAANELFYNEGVHTVGIDRVIEQAGVAKASLYNTFGSKDELVRAYLETRHASVTQRITAAVERYDTPRERLLAVFEGQGELFAQPDYRGCAFARASAESHPGDLVEQAAEAYRHWVRALLTGLAAQAGVPEPEVLARQLHLLYDGSGQSARMDHDPAAAAAARAAAATLLDAALARGTAS